MGFIIPDLLSQVCILILQAAHLLLQRTVFTYKHVF